MDDLSIALGRVADALDRTGIPYMVIGGLANLVWGEPRTTMDLDFTVDAGRLGTDGILRVAKEMGELLAEDPADVAERGRLVPVRTPEGVRVDLVLATLPFELEAIGRARVVDVAGTEARVCAPEDLIVMKSVSTRARDHDDVVGILRRRRSDLRLEELDRTIESLAADLGDAQIGERWRAARRAAGLDAE